MLRNPALSGFLVNQDHYTATPPLSSWAPKLGQKCYITASFLGVPMKEDKITSGNITPTISEAHMREPPHNPYVPGGPH